MRQLDRITEQPNDMYDKACICDLRVTVGMHVGQVGEVRSVEDILTDYPCLEREDLFQTLRYAAWSSKDCEVVNSICTEVHSEYSENLLFLAARQIPRYV